MPSLAQLLFEKACMKNELHYAKQHLRCYEYDYKCNRYAIVTPTLVVMQ